MRRPLETKCFTPRNYQVELLEKAIKSNIIVQLGTGAGKTFIAVLLLKEFGAQLFPEYKKGGKRAFFVVDKVNLVNQQAEHIECHTTLKVGRVHGNENTEVLKSKEDCDRFMRRYQVIVITAQCLLDMLDHALLSIDVAAVIIFDECHHAMGSRHPYRLIMDFYKKLSENSDKPRILGLTASLIKERTPPNKLEEKLRKLESIMCCTIETTSDLVSLSKYGARPMEGVVECENFEVRPEFKQILILLESVREFFDETTEFNKHLDMDPRKQMREAHKVSGAILKQLGPWTVWKMAQLWDRELKRALSSNTLPDKTTTFITLSRTAMVTIRRLLEPKMRNVKCIDDLRPYIPHKVIRIIEMLETFSPDFQKERMGIQDPEPLCAIIFVDQRYVAYSLYNLMKQLRSWIPKFKYLLPDYVVGASGSNLATSENQGPYKRQGEVLRKFHRGDLNLLIATNVLEEGVDVKQCNLVIKFDRPTDVRSYIQSKGRARKAGARYMVLVEERDKLAYTQDMYDFVKIEKLLLCRSKSTHNPSDDFDDLTLDNVDDLVVPYVVPSTGATVKMSNAIQLVNRYCSKLPSDIFTRLVSQCKIIVDESSGVRRYRAELLLPINSPIKHAIELKTPMETKKLAQMAVALDTCKLLHERGELDDNLLPRGREYIGMMLEHIDEEPDEYTPGLTAKVGSSKRKQLYDKKVARALHDGAASAGEPCYLYVMELERLKEPDWTQNPKRRKFVDPNEYNYNFGFLSTKILPKIPPFPVFLRQGDMRVRLQRCEKQVIVPAEHLEKIKAFHDYVFTQVLQLCRVGNMVFDISDNTPVNSILVPLSKTTTGNKYHINLTYVDEVVKNMREMPRAPDIETRKKYKFREEDYIDKVIMPWYRNVEQPTFCYVAEILNDMSPSSTFPDKNYTTFNEYFIRKYNIEIYDQEQSLLDVDFTSTRLNLLLPRASVMRRKSTSGASSKEAVTSESTDNLAKPSESQNSVDMMTNLQTQRQILVPELMDIHPVSATLWSLIAALPSILYRINHLLLADEFREIILKNVFEREQTEVPDGLEWSPLTYPSSYEEKQSTIVSKIQQLKEMNKKPEAEVIEEPEDPEEFNIGLWDPHDAEKLGIKISFGHDLTDQDHDAVGLLNSETVSGDLSDEDDDDFTPIVMHDFKKKIDAANAAKPSTDFWQPRDDIVETGWDDMMDETSPGEDPAIDTSFQIIADGAQGVDLNGLMADVQNIFSGVRPEEPTQIEQPQKEKSPVPPPVENNFIKPKLELTEERDKKRTEEIIDLDEFDDEKDDERTSIPLSDDDFDHPDTDTEIEVWTKAEVKKASDDLKAVDAVIRSQEKRKEGVTRTVYNSKFSFHQQSPSVSGVKSNALTGEAAKKEEKATTTKEVDTIGYGVSPCLLLTALTTSNAADGMSLERYETIGDSFLKYAVTDFLYHNFAEQHEGKLSFARSKEVSNCNLYRIGKKLGIPNLLVASKFDAHDSWLPPCYIPTENFKAPNADDAEETDFRMEQLLDGKEIEEKKVSKTGWDEGDDKVKSTNDGIETINFSAKKATLGGTTEEISPLPYNLLTQQHISDKSIADAVEALIGVHLLTLGPRPTLKVMKWMGLKVLAEDEVNSTPPLLRFIDTAADPNLSLRSLDTIWHQFHFASLEEKLGYCFKDRAYLVQAFTHASYMSNRVTGCYQRLEFLGDAVLDYVITRYLFEDEHQYSPGVLTDLRSALVNNTIFASLAVKYNFHKHFVAMCPGLHHMIEKFVKLCAERNFLEANFNTEMYMVTTEEEIDEGQEEDIEVPKAMSDIFESVAGAVYLDSGRDLDVAWSVLYNLMQETITECCLNPPRSPIRELLEMESSKARFSKMERIIESGKVRVTVDVGNNMRFTGMGRNYRIAKTTAAKRALRYLNSLEEQKQKTKAKEAAAN